MRIFLLERKKPKIGLLLVRWSTHRVPLGEETIFYFFASLYAFMNQIDSLECCRIISKLTLEGGSCHKGICDLKSYRGMNKTLCRPAAAYF